MKKSILAVLLVVGVVIGVPLVVYAVDYEGEYTATVSFTMSSSALGIVDVSNVQTSSESMDWFAFWDLLKGHSAADRSDFYTAYVDITQDASGSVVTESLYVEVPVGESKDVSIELVEVLPGDSTVRIYVYSMLTQSIVVDQTYDMIVG